MTLTILASVSLLALVSSARPLPKPDEHWKGLQLSAESGEPTDIQHVIQTVVKSHASFDKNLDNEDDVQVHIASVEEVQAYLSSAEDNAIKALIPLTGEELHSPDEKELHDILSRLENERGRGPPVSDDSLDTMSIGSPSGASSIKELPVDDTGIDTAGANSHTGFLASKPVVVIVASCVISFLVLCCVAASLYIVEVLRKSVFQSPAAWDILPQLEKDAVERSGQTGGVSHVSRETIQGAEKMPGALTVTTHLLKTRSCSSLREKEFEKASTDAMDSENELDEKFFDAELPDIDNSDSPGSSYATPTLGPVDLPPTLPTLAAAVATIAAVAAVSGNNSAPEMSEASAGARPSWSVRATEAKLPTVEPARSRAAVLHTGASREGRRRAYNAMPELDAALAMQLRPGLGVGADAAWLVRFVMALFGWCTVLMSGNTRRG
ncbi:hypothetical protein M0805_009472 [Coniferiporia weirii]|nr:hypothetical protein M0805_009472 [Coniferiporia weirii]